MGTQTLLSAVNTQLSGLSEEDQKLILEAVLNEMVHDLVAAEVIRKWNTGRDLNLDGLE